MKMKHLPFILTLLVVKICAAQIQESNLVGTWELKKTESDVEISETDIFGNSNKKSKEKEKNEADIILQFGEKGNLDIIQFGNKSRVKFTLKDSILTLGLSEYKILQLTNTELILTEPESLFSAKDFYVKTNKKIEPVKEVKKKKKKYDNGQLKLKGTLRNGIESGTWTEWHENGQKKSERSFLNGIPLGTWKEWDKNGKLTKEKKWN